MAQVASYGLLFYGGPDGYQTNRAQIQLSDAAGKSLAWIRFNDPGMFYETDYEDAGIIRMHLPSSMFLSCWKICGTKNPSMCNSPPARLLGTASEPIGEEESAP